MGVEAIIARACTQTAVYWGNPVSDGQGGKTFIDPVEIACRWEDMLQIVGDNKGETLTSRAVIYVTRDVQQEGMIYLGDFDDLNLLLSVDDAVVTIDDGHVTVDGENFNPMTSESIYTIKRFEKTPVLRGNEFLRKAYLTPSLSFGGF
jgi:hypothetical protein